MLDFQVVRFSSPVLDFQQLFYHSLCGTTRKKYFSHFMQVYYDRFSYILQTAGCHVPFTLEELVEEFDSKKMYGFIYGLGKNKLQYRYFIY